MSGDSSARPAVVLLSGGLDSATCLAIAADAGYRPLHTLAFDYGQRHRHELAAAEALARRHNARHRVLTIDLRQFGGSALTDDIQVPEARVPASHDDSRAGATAPPDATPCEQPPPVTYVPARNTIFLSYALAFCEVTACRDIYIGVNAVDYSGYPDCRPEFIDAFQRTARLGTRLGDLVIHAPLVNLTKAQIIRRGTDLGVPYELTHSCYDPTPDGLACGRCDSCHLRRRGFEEAGVPDPTRYAQRR